MTPTPRGRSNAAYHLFMRNRLRSHPLHRCLIMLASLLVWSAVDHARADAERIVQFRGYAFDLASDRPLYTEEHVQRWLDNRYIGGTITYFDLDGEQIGHKTLDFSGHPFVPVYRFEVPGRNYIEGISDNAKIVAMYKAGRRPMQTSRIPIKDQSVGDAGFDPFVRARFDELLAGRNVALDFIAAGMLDRFSLRLRRIEDGTFEGRPTMRIWMEPATLLRWVAPAIELAYDMETRRLVEYRGVSNLHDDRGKAYRVRISYYTETPEAWPGE